MEAMVVFLTQNIPLIPQFAFAHLEYVIAGVGSISAFVYIKTRKVNSYSNDLTPLIVKMNKYREAVNKQSK